MNYPYSTFFLDIQLAKRRLEQILATGPDVDDDLSPPSSVHHAPCIPAIGYPKAVSICQNSWRISKQCVAPSGANTLEKSAKPVTLTKSNSVSA
jgi:hypothetical protein